MAAPIYRGGAPFTNTYHRYPHNVAGPFLTSGAPVNGTSGTGAGVAGKGSFAIDYASGNFYINTGTKASPTWTVLDSAVAPVTLALTNAHVFVGSAGNVATDVAMSGDVAILNTGATTVTGVNGSATARTGTQINLLAAGVAAGYKVARGVHQQVAASDTIVSGLATVVAVVVEWQDAPTVKQLFLNATIGNQSGAPAAGSFLSRTYKPTAVNDVTPIAATDFTDNLSFNWVAVGT